MSSVGLNNSINSPVPSFEEDDKKPVITNHNNNNNCSSLSTVSMAIKKEKDAMENEMLNQENCVLDGKLGLFNGDIPTRDPTMDQVEETSSAGLQESVEDGEINEVSHDTDTV